ncbi:hypothetical protein [Cohnella sp. GbtcB17]|uniref:hypothetical protein n=1 Tax=Cohnella sp. GbtcB17 TaxID=2824762 RepID=UPI001C30BFFA|nr:hypothetical protein [Cohnella sp. GbtcB17]
MQNKFMELLQYFSTEPLEGSINGANSFEEVVRRMDPILNPKDNEAFRLVSHKVCPLVSSGARMKYIILGLNPHDDGEKGDLNHLKTWEELAKYHTPSALSGDHIFNRVLSPTVVPYYRRIGILIHSLEMERYVRWSEFREGLRGKPAITEKYIQMIEKTPIGVAELIPFASKKISVDEDKLKRLINEVDEYRSYLRALLDTILTDTTDDGWIICNGKGACSAFEVILNNESDVTTLISASDGRKYAFHIYKGKKVLMLYHFLNTQGGAFNTHIQIQDMLDDVIRHKKKLDEEGDAEGMPQ